MILNEEEQVKIDCAVTKLYHWQNTWKQESGAYNSFVVHRCDLKRLKEIHETPWGHCAIIEGLICLYEKQNDGELRSQIEGAVRLQISRMDDDGSFKNAGFEDDRFSSLVHNSMADRALLCYYKCSINNEELKKDALRTVKRNVDEYLIGELWNEETGAFRFSKIDYYSPETVRYVANMNCVAVEVMLGLYKIEKEKRYLSYSQKCGEWIKTQSVHSENPYCEGGISYGSNNPECLVSIYTGLCLPGICELYAAFQDAAYREMAVNAAKNLLSYSESGYFCHSMVDEEQKRYPYFLAGAGIILYGIEYVNDALNQNFDVKAYLMKILDKQYESGAVQNFMHYNSAANNRINGKENVEVWEDIVPCLPWNAQLFRYLVKISKGLMSCCREKTVVKIKWCYIYMETVKWFMVLSVYPMRSVVFLLINKKRDRSIIAFSLKGIVRKLRNVRNRRKT